MFLISISLRDKTIGSKINLGTSQGITQSFVVIQLYAQMPTDSIELMVHQLRPSTACTLDSACKGRKGIVNRIVLQTVPEPFRIRFIYLSRFPADLQTMLFMPTWVWKEKTITSRKRRYPCKGSTTRCYSRILTVG